LLRSDFVLQGDLLMSTDKFSTLKSLLISYKKVAVAYSGGVDSSLLVKLCADTLGPANVIAITGVSQTYTEDEKKIAQQITGKLGVELVLLQTDELSSDSFASNPTNRCYHCKKELYGRLVEIAKGKGATYILDGTNADDLGDYRPGRKAADEFGVVSPFVIAGITKSDIRDLSRTLDLPAWDKPANPCLASRVPYGTRITESILRQIEAGERVLKNLGIKNVRLRHHDMVARIEVSPQDFGVILDDKKRRYIIDSIKKIGYKWVALDLEGYRTGSLNE
jgi:pyridinium-3,5-biscarboxylic acid mononucleotide sulfurtransferase